MAPATPSASCGFSGSTKRVGSPGLLLNLLFTSEPLSIQVHPAMRGVGHLFQFRDHQDFGADAVDKDLLHGYWPAKGAQVFECGISCAGRAPLKLSNRTFRTSREVNPVQ
jgi:hypothetical protein